MQGYAGASVLLASVVVRLHTPCSLQQKGIKMTNKEIFDELIDELLVFGMENKISTNEKLELINLVTAGINKIMLNEDKEDTAG